MRSFRTGMLLVLAFLVAGCAAEGMPTDVGAITQEVQESLDRGKKHDRTYEPYVAGSPQRQALDALADADRLVVHSLLSEYDYDVMMAMDRALPPGRSDGAQQRALRDQWCRRGPCLGGQRKLGNTTLATESDKAVVQALLEGWMGKEPNYGTACIAQYHHAVSFAGGGHAYDVLLCYGCGQYKLLRDGVEVAEGQGAHPVGHTVLNQRLAAAGLSYFDADKEAWRGPPLPAEAFAFGTQK